jgi:hypothetical protein
MDVIARPGLEAKMACVHNLKELLNLWFKVVSVDILALIEKKMTTQVDLVVAHFEVIVTEWSVVMECMLEKKIVSFVIFLKFWFHHTI